MSIDCTFFVNIFRLLKSSNIMSRPPDWYMDNMTNDNQNSFKISPKALLAELNITEADFTVLKDYCTQVIDKNCITDKEIKLTDWEVHDAGVTKVLKKVKNIVPVLSVGGNTFQKLLHVLHFKPEKTKEDLRKIRDGLNTQNEPTGRTTPKLVKGFHVTNNLSSCLSRIRLNPCQQLQIQIDIIREIVWAIVDPDSALNWVEKKLVKPSPQSRSVNECIVSKLVIIHAVTLSCADYSHKMHFERSFRFYKDRK